jgi:hypothetical protein
VNFSAIVFTSVAGFFLLRLPRQWAALPLLVGATYMTLGPSLDVGPFHFTVIRILIAVGFLRVLVKGERLPGNWSALDSLVVAWAIWVVCSSGFHENFGEALVFRLGLAYNALGLYFLLRVFIHSEEEVLGLCRVVILALIPIALEMVNEALTGKNLFSFLGGVPELSEIRGGHIRAQGPFAHSILAGTVGAVCMPMATLFWKENRKLALAGLAATGAMVLCSRSSGPIMTTLVAWCAIAFWRFRSHLRLVRWSAIFGIVALSLVMKAPVYYLIDRIDFTGNSASWHRAYLIESALNHLDEWWLGGTDYTRNWTANTGMSENDTDITNNYIRMGVTGGLPLVLIFVSAIIVAFRRVGGALRSGEGGPRQRQFLIWTLGCILFAHVATMISVSYYDQSIFFLYLVLAAIGSLATRLSLETFESNRFMNSSAPSNEIFAIGAE